MSSYSPPTPQHQTSVTSDRVAIPSDDDPRAIVYYATTEHGGVVKIGTTVDPGRRMALLTLRHNTLVSIIASEPGGVAVEAERHRQFAHRNAFGEWFWMSPDVIAFIECIRAGMLRTIR